MVQAGIKQSKLAELAGVSKGYVSELVSGAKKSPSVEASKKFAEILGVSPEWLLTGHAPLYNPDIAEETRIRKGEELKLRAQQCRDLSAQMEKDRKELVEMAELYEEWAQSLLEPDDDDL